MHLKPGLQECLCSLRNSSTASLGSISLRILLCLTKPIWVLYELRSLGLLLLSQTQIQSAQLPSRSTGRLFYALFFISAAVLNRFFRVWTFLLRRILSPSFHSCPSSPLCQSILRPYSRQLLSCCQFSSQFFSANMASKTLVGSILCCHSLWAISLSHRLHA